MGLLDTIRRRAADGARAALRSAGARLGAALPREVAAILGSPAVAPTTVPTLDDWDVEDVRQALLEHETGVWARSALLADHMGRNDRLAGVLSTRILAATSLPWSVEPAEGSTDRTFADLDRASLRGALTRAAAGQVIADVAMLGLCVCQRHYHLGRDGRWRITLEPWHLSWCRWDPTGMFLLVQTREGVEEVPLDNSNPRWFVFRALGGDRPWMAGALRPLAIPYLIVTWADRDWARWSEKHGLPPLAVKVPVEERFSKATAAFLEDLQELATEPTILLAQGEDGGHDIDWKELKNWQSYQGFEAMAERQNTRFSIVLVGQNLTTEVQGGSFAATTAHMQVRHDILESDALLLSSGVYEAVALEQHRLNVTEVDPEVSAPRPLWDATPRSTEPIPPEFVTSGVVTPDEARARYGLPPLPDGSGAVVREPVADDPFAGLLSAPGAPSLRARRAPPAVGSSDEGLVVSDEIRAQLVAVLSKAHGPKAAAMVDAIRGAQSAGEARARLADLLGAEPDPEVVRDVARAFVLARLSGRLSAKRAAEAVKAKGRRR